MVGKNHMSLLKFINTYKHVGNLDKKKNKGIESTNGYLTRMEGDDALDYTTKFN
jgi:hypothetical protein